MVKQNNMKYDSQFTSVLFKIGDGQFIFSVFKIEYPLLYYERFARLGLIGKYSSENVG